MRLRYIITCLTIAIISPVFAINTVRAIDYVVEVDAKADQYDCITAWAGDSMGMKLPVGRK